MKSIVITGCNRGIGLGIVRRLTELSRPPEYIFATCRDVAKAEKLKALAEKAKNIHIIEIDLRDTESYGKIVEAVSGKVGDQGLNVLFNNAGVSCKFTRLGLVKEQQLSDVYLVNTIAPIMLTKALYPLLKKAAEGQHGLGVDRAAVINMTSILGSIADNEQGGFYPYRCSKAALNAATRSMSIDFKDDGILATCVHPGWVKTDMGGPNAPLRVDDCAKAILETVLSLGVKDNGSFVRWDGRSMPW